MGVAFVLSRQIPLFYCSVRPATSTYLTFYEREIFLAYLNVRNYLSQMNRVHLLFETIVGSQAYGLAGPRSDRDLKGVYVEPRELLLSMEPPAPQVELDGGNVVYYALRKFLSLALTANPNIIEMLFMPDDCLLHVDTAFQCVLEQRSLFVTKQAYATHVRYAEAQIRKARGRNKWINNPQPEAQPQLEDFCWVLKIGQSGGMPLRPVALKLSGVDLGCCHASAVEQPGAYGVTQVSAPETFHP